MYKITDSGIQAKVILDSIYNGKRLTTIQTTAPKYIDSEVEKHRVLSSNSSSDRAIPFKKMVEKPVYIPQDIRLNEPGMQGYKLANKIQSSEFLHKLEQIREMTIHLLKDSHHIHKQHLNRALLGTSLQDKVISGTEWDNFFELRLDSAADPAIHELALCMKHVMEESTPTQLCLDDYHLPYVTPEDKVSFSLGDVIKISVARCARVSYLNHDNSDPDPRKDIELYQMLLDSKHMSPFEHVAKPMRQQFNNGRLHFTEGVTALDKTLHYWSGNFKGWIQHRYENE